MALLTSEFIFVAATLRFSRPDWKIPASSSALAAALTTAPSTNTAPLGSRLMASFAPPFLPPLPMRSSSESWQRPRTTPPQKCWTSRRAEPGHLKLHLINVASCPLHLSPAPRHPDFLTSPRWPCLVEFQHVTGDRDPQLVRILGKYLLHGPGYDSGRRWCP